METQTEKERNPRRRGNKEPAPERTTPPPPPKTERHQIIYTEGTFGDKIVSINPSTARDFPHNCIGLIKFKTFEKGEWKDCFGTGFLIDADLVLTSARNIYNRNDKKSSKQLKFYPGVCGELEEDEEEDRERVRAYGVQAYRFPEQFKDCYQQNPSQYDYGLLKLKNKVRRYAYIALDVNYSKQADEKTQLFGYNKNSVTEDSAKQVGIIKDSGQFEIDRPYVYHNLSTATGNSGSPIFQSRTSKLSGSDLTVAIAIHQGYNSVKQQNRGRLITDDLIENIIRWKKEVERGSNITNQQKEMKIDDYLSSKMSIEEANKMKEEIRVRNEEIQRIKAEWKAESDAKNEQIATMKSQYEATIKKKDNKIQTQKEEWKAETQDKSEIIADLKSTIESLNKQLEALKLKQKQPQEKPSQQKAKKKRNRTTATA